MSQVVIEMMQAAARGVVASAEQSATEIQAGRLVTMEPMRRQIAETTRRLMTDPAAVTVDIEFRARPFRNAPAVQRHLSPPTLKPDRNRTTSNDPHRAGWVTPRGVHGVS